LKTTVILIILLTFCGCKKKAQDKSFGVLPVEVCEVKLDNYYYITRFYSGKLRPKQSSDLSFGQQGTLASIFVEKGESVEKGTFLAKLDTRSLEATKAVISAQRDSQTQRIGKWYSFRRKKYCPS